ETYGQGLPPTAAAVRAEALKPNAGPEGRPLPLAAHWHSNFAPLDWQIGMIEGGRHILPFLYMLPPRVANDVARLEERTKPGLEAGLRRLAAWKMPFVMITGGQWENDFFQNREFFELPPEENPCVIDAETGAIQKLVSPLGPVERWRELGRQWGGTAYFRWLAEVYPDPPQVVLVSNNEAKKLRWHALESEKRYVEHYGLGRSDDFKRAVYEDLFYERYRAMFEGIREALPNAAWREHAVIAGYNGGPGANHVGRPGLEREYKPLVRLDRPARNTWEGALPEAYDNPWQPLKTDHHVWSTQTEMMNLVFQKQRALQTDPEWWMEVIFWNGGPQKALAYERKGLSYPAARYGAWAQYVLWTLTPRVARQWNGSSDPRENWMAEFGTILRAVDRIHADPVLARFWRQGTLVHNPEGGHPFDEDLPEGVKDQERWFRLSTDRDPPRPWTMTTELPAYVLAHAIGKAPAREWLLYGHAPLGDLAAVKITIPGYRDVSLDIPFAGAFHHVREQDGSMVEVGRDDALPYTANTAPVVRDRTYAVAKNQALAVTPMRFSGGESLLSDAMDDEGDALTALVAQPPRHGALELRPDGSFTYRPKKDFVGTDTFTFQAGDGRVRSEPAEVTLRVLDAPVAVVDDASAAVSFTAFAEQSDKQGFRGGFTYFAANPYLGGDARAEWRFADLPPDTYAVFATWPEFSYQRPKAVPYEIFDGAESRGRTAVSQEKAPVGHEAEGVRWHALGVFEIKGGLLRVELGNAVAGRHVIADAVRVVGRQTATTRVIDDSQPGFAARPAWNARPEGFGGGSRWARARTVPTPKRGQEAPRVDCDTAVWTVADLAPGRYELYATWPPDADADKAATFEAHAGGQRPLRAKVDQRQAPRDLLASGVWWQHLGTVEVVGETLRVELTAMAPKGKPRVVADAIAVFKRPVDERP
ncbi:MAG: cadherin-like domain-containing protein, partial [Sedimentisphaerales bacterium]|nr:cadherin-like domain-containing protein [Sedimentisphaerales bacterium]